MPIQNNIREVLKGHHKIPVVTFNAGDDPIEFVKFLRAQNIHCIEITLRTSFGLKAIELLKNENIPNFLIGAGTVSSFNQVNQLKKIGTDFIVSPGLSSKLQIFFEESGIPYLPGVATPTEIIHAIEMGLNTLKFFPANLFGGTNALKTYKNIFPEITFCPTGGINKNTSAEFLSLENVFAVGGSWFQSEFNNREN